MSNQTNSHSVLKSLRTVFLASTLAAGLTGAALVTTGLVSSPASYAEPVTVVAPQAPSFADVVEAVSPAVVSVRVEAEVQPASNQGNFRFDRRHGEDFFRDFFRDRERGERHGFRDRRERRHGRQGPRSPRRFGMSQGSGFFVSEDGYIVTNHHVIENGSKFTVVMNDGTEMKASLVGADSRTDLAVLKVEADKKFTYVAFGEKNPRIGDWVVAVGNPFGLGGTVTAGIVSANGREISRNRFDDFIQIDAAVNKGNSGGPAFNLSGEVIGVNTAIFSPSGGNVGIAFAIPAKVAKEIVDDLIDDGQVVRGWLGVQIQPVTKDIAESVGLDEAMGAIVTDPQNGSPAEKAGIRAGDVIVEVDGRSIKGPKELAKTIGSYQPDSKVEISIWRNGEAMDVSVTLGSLNVTAANGKTPKSTVQSLAGLGLELDRAPDGSGVVVANVDPDSGAAKKGLKPGDIITSVNGEEVNNPGDVQKIVSQADELGRKATLFQIRRGDSTSFVAVPFARG